MERRRLVLAVAALLTVAALGFAAAAVDDGGTGGDGGDTSTTTTGEPSSQESASATLATAVVVLLVAAAVAAVAYSVYKDAIPRWLTVTLVVAVVVLLVLVGLGYVLDPPEPTESASEETTPEQPDQPYEETEGAGSGDTGSGLSPTTTLAVLGLLLLAGAITVARYTRGGSPVEDEPEESEDATAVAEAAGRAADELGETTLSNAIYRAWREMTDVLDVDKPETTTPAEFEEAAVAAGIAREDVATLTDLFREVRYGDAPATPEREQRAREALRTIEDAYADASADGEAEVVDSSDGPDAGDLPGGDQQ